MGRWHIFRQACSVSSFIWLRYHDFGVIDPPFGARDFVSKNGVCRTKTHLASIKKEYFIASTDHSISLVLEFRLEMSTSRLINFSRSRDLEVSRLTSSNCGAESIALSTQSSLARSEDLLPLLG